MSNIGLSVGDIVNISVSLTPVAASQRNFGTPLILGDSTVIDTTQRLRLYSSIEDVGADFGGDAPEYEAAELFFGQFEGDGTACYIGRWAPSGSSGVLSGSPLTTAEQALSIFTAITSGGLNVTVDNTLHELQTVNLSGVTNLNGVASIITAALGDSATCVWSANNENFVITSASTGSSSQVSFATPGSGTDLSGPMGLQASDGGYTALGIIAETIESAVNVQLGLSNLWYMLQIASTTAVEDVDYENVAGIIQAANPSRVFGVTTQEGGALLSSSTTDLAALLSSTGYGRTFCQYSSTAPYATASIDGILGNVDFEGDDTTITVMFKQEEGVEAEYLTETQAAVLAAKNCNVYVWYNDNETMLQQGVMTNGTYIDVVQGTDWLQNALQAAVFTVYLQTGKVPQTDSGLTQLIVQMTSVLEQAVDNGLIAPGVWNGPPIGSIVTGQTLSTGYYIYAPTVASQSQAARQARQTPAMQIAVKLAGAFQSANVLVSVNS